MFAHVADENLSAYVRSVDSFYQRRRRCGKIMFGDIRIRERSVVFVTNNTKVFLQSMGIPWTMKARNLMSDKELTDTLLKLTKMKREEYEERCREYDTTGIWKDTMHEILIEACNWIQIGITIQRKRPWLNPNMKKANNMLFCTQKRQRKEKI